MGLMVWYLVPLAVSSRVINAPGTIGIPPGSIQENVRYRYRYRGGLLTASLNPHRRCESQHIVNKENSQCR